MIILCSKYGRPCVATTNSSVDIMVLYFHPSILYNDGGTFDSFAFAWTGLVLVVRNHFIDQMIGMIVITNQPQDVPDVDTDAA